MRPHTFFFFFFNDTATTEIYTLSLHDALPISEQVALAIEVLELVHGDSLRLRALPPQDRKSTRLNSSHLVISYAVFCLKKKNNILLPFFTLPPTLYPIHQPPRRHHNHEPDVIQ